MSISLTRVFLPILLVLAFVVRWEPTRTLRLAPDERDLGASRWLIDDPDTCQHMRRIELAIATDKVVSFDRFVSFPQGGEIPALPLFDTVVAGIAQRFLRSPTGEVALGYVDEPDLEDMVIKLAPILGLLMVLATWIAARNVVSGPRGDAAALLAAAIVALHPSCVAITAAGALVPMALAAVLFALTIRSVVRCVSAEAMPGALLDAMVGGALAGMACACTSLGLVLFVPAWIAVFLRVLRSAGDERAKALRAGLLFCLVAAFIARMPLNEGPWEEREGIVRGFASGVSMVLFLSTAPFIVMLLMAREEKQRAFRTLCFVAGLILMAWQLPQLWRDLAPAVRWFTSNRQLIHETLPGLSPKFGLATVSAIAGVLVCSKWVWRDRAHPITSALLFFAFVTALTVFFLSSALPLALVALACLAARALDLGLARDEVASRKPATMIAIATCALLLVCAIVSWANKTAPTEREERIDFCAGLRWMREHTQSGGAWNAPRGANSWGVLSSVAAGPLVEYHARRPAVLSPWATLSGAREMHEARSALFGWTDLSRLMRTMHGDEARYVVTSGRKALEALDPWRRFAVDPESGPVPSAYDALAAAEPDASVAAAGFVREYASRRQVPDYPTAKLVIAIHRLDATPAPPHAEMRPR